MLSGYFRADTMAPKNNGRPKQRKLDKSLDKTNGAVIVFCTDKGPVVRRLDKTAIKLIRIGVSKAAVRDAAGDAEKKTSMKARDFGIVKVMMRGR